METKVSCLHSQFRQWSKVLLNNGCCSSFLCFLLFIQLYLLTPGCLSHHAAPLTNCIGLPVKCDWGNCLHLYFLTAPPLIPPNLIHVIIYHSPTSELQKKLHSLRLDIHLSPSHLIIFHDSYFRCFYGS